MLPLAACLALAMTSTVAHAQLTNQSVACSGAQKTEGEGGSESTFASRQKTEGEGGSASTFASRQKTEGEGGSASTWAQQQKAGAVIPCKG
jgi:hypothetical protein